MYEFGPEDGRKVLFIHGISTSCMTLKDIATPLAAKGCRVMLFVSYQARSSYNSGEPR